MKKTAFIALICLLTTFYSCNDDEYGINIPQQSIKNINQLSYEDLFKIEMFFKYSIQSYNTVLGANLDFSSFNLEKQKEFVTNKGLQLDSLYVNTYKISYRERHPSQKNVLINNSGILLLPSKNILADGKSCKLIIIAPGAFSNRNEAASIVYKDSESLNNQSFENKLTSFFSILLAMEGFAVLIPDYPGFGDSYGECFIPILEAKPMANSLINLTKATQKVISKLEYSEKDGVVLSGYSLGGYVSGLAGKKNETEKKELNVDLLLIGGALTSLKFLAEEVKIKHQTIEHLIFPWAIEAYKYNGYPSLYIDNIINKDQQSIIKEYLMSGNYTSLDIINKNVFPTNSSDFYTSKYISSTTNDPSYTYLNQILTENSLRAWKNTTNFKMIHAVNDKTAYYEAAKNFADEVNGMGGYVHFETSIGAHAEGALFFYQRLLENSMNFKK